MSQSCAAQVVRYHSPNYRHSYRVSNASTYRSANSRSRRSSTSRVPKASYRLDAGDMLAVIVDGVLGDFKDAPVHWPQKDSDTLPSMGHPVPVLSDGTVYLPLVRQVNVRGLTVLQANRKIARAYVDGRFLKNERSVIVSLLRKRTVSVTILQSNPGRNRSAATTVDVQADHASVLSALAKAGAYDADALIQVLRSSGSRRAGLMTPVRDGDVINMQSPPDQFYYTGGLLPAGEHAIPRGRRPTMLQAMAAAGGSVGGSRFGPGQLVVIPRNGRPYSLDAVRGGRANRINPGDTLLLRYRPQEAISQIGLQTLLRFGVFGF